MRPCRYLCAQATQLTQRAGRQFCNKNHRPAYNTFGSANIPILSAQSRLKELVQRLDDGDTTIKTNPQTIEEHIVTAFDYLNSGDMRTAAFHLNCVIRSEQNENNKRYTGLMKDVLHQIGARVNLDPKSYF